MTELSNCSRAGRRDVNSSELSKGALLRFAWVRSDGRKRPGSPTSSESVDHCGRLGPPAGRARFLVARAPCRARFSPISVHGPAGFTTVSVHDQARRGRPDFVHWRPCSNGGLRTARRRHCTNPCRNRPSSAQSPGRLFRAPRAAASCPAGCSSTRSAEAPQKGFSPN